MGRAKGSISDNSFLEHEQEQFDYILHPSLAGYIVKMIMPVIVFLIPLGVLYIAPEVYAFMGITSLPVGLIAAGAGVFCIVNAAVLEFRRRSTKLKLNIDYLIYKKGILFISIDKVYFQDIKNVKVFRTLSDRMLGIGGLGIATAGTGGYEVVITGFRSPEAIMRYIAVHRKEGE